MSLDDFDILSVGATLYVNGKYRYSTKFGGLLSIFALFGIFTLCSYFICHYLNKKDSNINFNSTNKFNTYLNISDMPFIFSFQNSNNVLINPRIAQLTMQYWKYTKSGKTVIPLTLEKCDINIHFKEEHKEIFKNIDLYNYSCLSKNNTNITMYGKGETNEHAYLNMYFNTCYNSTYNNNNCLPKDEINKYHTDNNIYLKMGFLNYEINNNNFNNPFSGYASFISYPLSNNFLYNYLLPWI